MGMDVYGKEPTNETGKYFRRNVWGWHPLWELCCFIAPGVAGAVEHGHTNDGDGLGTEQSRVLAALLRVALENGEINRYVKARDERLSQLPDKTCMLCKGTGKRMDMKVENGCNGCNGKGKERPHQTFYSVDRTDVKEFAAFLETCGGFRIC